ncbi:MAG: TldD/PmbA family protein [bacterium]
MIEPKRTIDLLKSGLSRSTADQTELLLTGEDFSLTRFSESQIRDNLFRSEYTVYARAIKEKRIGVATTTGLTEESIQQVVDQACRIAELAEPDEKFVSLPEPTGKPEPSTTSYRETERCSPQRRAEGIKLIADAGSRQKLAAAGAFETTTEFVAVVNSLGMERFWDGTSAELSLTLSGETGNSGWALGYNRNIEEMDVAMLAGTAVDKAMRSREPISIETGQYTVILEPAAVGQLLLFLSFMGFGCKTLMQHRSFMAGKIGEQITGTNITITEDAFHPELRGQPFDYEGVVRKRVPLIEHGIAKGVVYDTYHANLMDAVSTGHALPPDNQFGPYPKNLVMDPGEQTLPEMIASVERGVYITHFWYINYLNPMQTMVTGTTRDGTFLIEGGEVTRPINNMRIAQSILEAFSNAPMLSTSRTLYPQYSVVMLVPAMKVEGFNLEQVEE